MQDESFYRDVVGALRFSAMLEKRAALGEVDRLRQKAANDFTLLQQIKEAIDWAALKPAMQKGLVGGTAAALPALGAGSYLLHKAHKEREQTVEDIRNKALQVALGIGSIGAGLLGLHHSLASRRAAATPPAAPAMSSYGGPTMGLAPSEPPPETMMTGGPETELSPEELQALQYLSPEELQMLFKQGSADDASTLQKLATVGYLDTVLEEAERFEKTAAVREDAHALRLLNAEHGAQLLRELLEVT